MRFAAIPYRRWRRRREGDAPYLQENAAYARVMRRVGEAISDGRSVNVDHRIVNPESKINHPYDVIDVEIEDIRP